MASDRPEAVGAYLACFLAGIVPVHVNDRLTGREVDAVLADADVRGFGYTADLAGRIATSETSFRPANLHTVTSSLSPTGGEGRTRGSGYRLIQTS